MSPAGPQTGMTDVRFDPFFNMVKIIHILQKVQCMPPLYLLENTWLGFLGKKMVDETAELIKSFLGIPVCVDVAGMGSAAHRVRHYWTNFCEQGLLENAMPRDVTPYIPLAEILDPMHFPSKSLVASTWPFVDHNRIGFERICLPTIVSYPGSYAF